MAEDQQSCPKCGILMLVTDQIMLLEPKHIRIVLLYRCPECGTTVDWKARVDKGKMPWVKKTVYRGESLGFVFSEKAAKPEV